MSKLLFAAFALLVNVIPTYASDSLRVSVVVNHLNSIPDSLGSISINVNGGIPPYRFIWDDTNEDTNSRDHLYSGTYNVLVRDGQGLVKPLSVSLFFEQLQQYSPGDSVVNTSDTIRTFIFSNQLLPGKNGSINYTVDDIVGEQTLGLTTDTIYSGFPSYGFFINKTRLFLIAGNRISGNFGKVKKGDVLSVIKENGRIIFRKNDKALSDHHCQESLYRTVLHTRRSRARKWQMLTTFNKALNVFPVVTDFTCSTGSRATVAVHITGGTGPYTTRVYYGYEVSEQNAVTGEIPRAGNYTVIVADRDANERLAHASVGYSAEWRSRDGFILSKDSIRKTGDEGWCNSKISSVNRIRPDSDGWVEFLVPDTASQTFIGFAQTGMSGGISLTQGIYIDHHKILAVTIDQDGGYRKQLLKTFLKKSLIKLSIVNGSLSYFINGQLVLQEPLLLNTPCQIDAHVFSQHTGINSFRTSYNCER